MSKELLETEEVIIFDAEFRKLLESKDRRLCAQYRNRIIDELEYRANPVKVLAKIKEANGPAIQRMDKAITIQAAIVIIDILALILDIVAVVIQIIRKNYLFAALILVLLILLLVCTKKACRKLFLFGLAMEERIKEMRMATGEKQSKIFTPIYSDNKETLNAKKAMLNQILGL